MTANLENIHEIYNIFCQKNRMNADIINLFDHFHLSKRLRHLKMEKQQGVSASLLIVLLCLFRMCHESIVFLKKDFMLVSKNPYVVAARVNLGPKSLHFALKTGEKITRTIRLTHLSTLFQK